jgi:hypothetical protein
MFIFISPNNYLVLIMSQPIVTEKTKLKLKKKKFYDEYVLTNKHIICKFKYLVVCFDRPDNPSLSGGLINISKSRMEELFVEQNVQLDSSKENLYFSDLTTSLKEWHPQISKVEIDCKNIYEMDGLNDYHSSLEHIFNQLKQLPNNNCVKSEKDFDLFKQQPHKIVDVKVSFQLIRKIDKVDEYNVNFNYLHKLLEEPLSTWTKNEPIFFDEVTVNLKQVPFADQLKYSSDEDEDTCYVYPYVNFISLYPIID